MNKILLPLQHYRPLMLAAVRLFHRVRFVDYGTLSTLVVGLHANRMNSSLAIIRALLSALNAGRQYLRAGRNDQRLPGRDADWVEGTEFVCARQSCDYLSWAPMATMASWFNYRRRLLLLLLIGVAVLAISARISYDGRFVGGT